MDVERLDLVAFDRTRVEYRRHGVDTRVAVVQRAVECVFGRDGRLVEPFDDRERPVGFVAGIGTDRERDRVEVDRRLGVVGPTRHVRQRRRFGDGDVFRRVVEFVDRLPEDTNRSFRDRATRLDRPREPVRGRKRAPLCRRRERDYDRIGSRDCLGEIRRYRRVRRWSDRPPFVSSLVTRRNCERNRLRVEYSRVIIRGANVPLNRMSLFGEVSSGGIPAVAATDYRYSVHNQSR